MKLRVSNPFRPHHLLLAAGSSLLAISSASAQTGTWNVDAGGLWSSSSNWTPGIADGAGFIANFTNNITADRTVNLDLDRTINRVNFADSTTSSAGSWILDNNGTATNNLILSGTTGAATGTVPVIDVGTLGTNKTATISAIIEGSYGFNKTGAGTLVLSGNNTYTGVTAISKTGGFLTVSHNNALGSTAADSHTTIETDGKNTARISVSSGITTMENITITGTTEASGWNPVLVGAGTYSGTITLDGTGAIRIAAANWTGTITQAGTKTNGLVFQGGTSVSNPMTINGGALTILNGTTTLKGASGSGIGSTTLTQNGVLKLGITNAIRTDRDLYFDTNGTNRLNLAGLNQTVRGLVSSGGTNTRTVNNDTNLTTSTLTVGNGGGDYSFNGTIINATSGTGKVALVKTGAGNQTLSGINTYTGGTRIDEGILTLGHATDTLASGGAVNVNGGTLAIGANSDTVGAVTLTSGSITGSTGTLIGTGSAYDVRSGAVSAKLGGSVGLTKTTDGIVTLSGVNAYSGATAVNAGRLSIDTTGTINSTSGVSIGAGEFNYNNSTTALTQGITFSGTTGTLSGTGAINPAVIITSGNRQTAGTSVTSVNTTATLGTQTFSTSIDYQAGSIFEWNLTANDSSSQGTRGTNYDAVNTAGLLNTGADAIFRVVLDGTQNFSESFWNTSRSWTDIFKDGDTALNIESIFGTGSTVQYYNSTGEISNGNTTGRSFTISGTTLNWTAVPEPTSALAGLLLGAGLLRRRRK